MDTTASQTAHLVPPIANICFMGAGHIGGLTATVMAHQLRDKTFEVIDWDASKITAWNSNSLPIDEPGFQPLLHSVRDGSPQHRPNLSFSTNLVEAIRKADILFITIEPDSKNINDLHHYETLRETVETIAKTATRRTIIVVKSTIGCSETEYLQLRAQDLVNPSVTLTVLSNPEFLAAGTAVSNLMSPDRVVIGSAQDIDSLLAATALQNMYQKWVPPERIKLMDIASAELTKLLNNALLAQRISSINSMSMVCQEVGADINAVAEACGLDHRLGQHMLRPSMGFRGSCLEKDVMSLAAMSDRLSLTHVGAYWRAIVYINELSKSGFINIIVRQLNIKLTQAKIAVLGCAFKRDTGDIRGSCGLALVIQLLGLGAHVAVYDRRVKEKDLVDAISQVRTLPIDVGVRYTAYDSVYRACHRAQAIIIANDMEEISGPSHADFGRAFVPMIDWRKIAAEMVSPKMLFDGCRIIDKQKLANVGIRVVYRLGDKAAV